MKVCVSLGHVSEEVGDTTRASGDDVDDDDDDRSSPSRRSRVVNGNGNARVSFGYVNEKVSDTCGEKR